MSLRNGGGLSRPVDKNCFFRVGAEDPSVLSRNRSTFAPCKRNESKRHRLGKDTNAAISQRLLDVESKLCIFLHYFRLTPAHRQFRQHSLVRCGVRLGIFNDALSTSSFTASTNIYDNSTRLKQTEPSKSNSQLANNSYQPESWPLHHSQNTVIDKATRLRPQPHTQHVQCNQTQHS